MWKELIAIAGLFAAYQYAIVRNEEFRVDNFSAGPGTLPLPVLKIAQKEFLNYHGNGMSIFEMSHRDHDGPVQTVLSDAANSLRRLLDIPKGYTVMFMSGGAHAQFAALPLNLGAKGHYVVTGYWSNRAKEEAQSVLGDASAVTSVSGVASNQLVDVSEWQVPADASYVHICGSETIDGYEFLSDPTVPDNVPLVGDFTSTLLSRRIDVSKYGVIYASGGKNLGPSGMAAIIVRDDLIAVEKAGIPSVLSWFKHANSKPIPSIYNTPPVWNIYMHKLVLDNLESRGGLAFIEERAKRRAAQIYDIVDASQGYYYNPVANKSQRSRMNVPMTVGNGDTRRRDLEKLFVEQANAKNLRQLFGHPVKGGLRVTLYNGVSDESVDRVAKFMVEFQKNNPLK